MEEKEASIYLSHLIIPKPVQHLVIDVLSLHAHIFHTFLASLFSPILFLFALLYESFCRAQSARSSLETAVVHRVPAAIILVLKKLGFGLLGAIHVCVLLTVVMGVAVAVGFGLVHASVEERVVLGEKVFFDYTDANPKAVLNFEGGTKQPQEDINLRVGGIPLGHKFHVSVLILMPESDHNRQLGVFQLTAEILSSNGDVIARSSQPCMLRFRSLPIRLARTLLMGVPLILGLSSETQKMSVEMMQHKEGIPRTGAIRVTMSPRAGTWDLPQLYEARILVKSQLPWTKELVRSWKWTVCVWTSIYVYMMLVIILLCWFRAVMFPLVPPPSASADYQDGGGEAMNEARSSVCESAEIEFSASEVIRRMQQQRRKRKASFLGKDRPETVGSSASSMSVSREGSSAVVEEDVGDSESVCLGG